MVRTHLSEVTVVGMDRQLAIKQAKNTDTTPNYQATLAFYRLYLEKSSIIECSGMLYK